ncbi:MAG: thioredoxin domain-containing protein [Desulfobacterales bacterium]
MNSALTFGLLVVSWLVYAAPGFAAVTVEDRYPGLAGGVLRAARLAELPPAVLFKSAELEIRTDELDRLLREAPPDWKPQLEKNRFFLLEREAGRRILVREARREGLAGPGVADEQAVEAFLRRLGAKASVSQTEVRAFYEQNRGMIGEAPYEQVSGAIRRMLLQQKQEQAVVEFLLALEKRIPLEVNAAWLPGQAALARDNAVDRARLSGRPTVVEFGATGCVPCDMMQPILDKLRKAHAERLNVVFVHVGEEKVLAARHGIRAIPVQVFFDRGGREFFRHEGFFPEAEVNRVLAQMGVR